MSETWTHALQAHRAGSVTEDGTGRGVPLISSTEDFRVRTSRWPVSGVVFPATAAVSGMNSDASCGNCGHGGSSLRMFPDSLASALALPVGSSSPGQRSTTSAERLKDEQALADVLSAARGKNYAQVIRDVTLRTSSLTWRNSGSGGPTGYVTHSTSEFPSEGVASSLSDVLETRPVPRKYWLSAKAAEGILRRAAKRQKTLPQRLMTALEGLAASCR